MKIKCPACSTVLSVPDTAAGKVVKCPCGKQLRAPGGAASATTATARPAAAPRPVATGARPAAAPAAPAARRPSEPTSDFDPGIFDELTDGDLQPVKAVSQPGSAGGKLLKQYGSSSHGGGMTMGGANRPIAGVGQRIGGALIDGFFNAIGMGVGAALMFGIMAARGVDDGDGGGGSPTSDPAFWAFLFATLIPPIINAVLVSKSGQSIGKKVVGTVIVDETTGAPVGFMQGIVQRNIVFGFFTGLPFVGIFVLLADIVFLFLEDHKTLHDKYAKTLVVEAR